MCGRYVLPDEEAVFRAWPKARCECPGWFRPRFNVAPTCSVPILVPDAEGSLTLRPARWGLVPEWWSQADPPARTFNARSEEAADKPVWREALRRSRCLMPALGWFEWNENQSVPGAAGRLRPQPYFIRCPGTEVIAFAALWSLWARPGSEPVATCAVLTKSAAPAIAAIHHRMPVVLKSAHQAAWLDPAAAPETLSALVADACQDFEGRAVSPRVNSTRHDDPALLDPAPVQTMDTLGL